MGESSGGLVPDNCCEEEAACLQDMARLINDYHDNSRYSHSWQQSLARADQDLCRLHPEPLTKLSLPVCRVYTA